MLHHKAPHGKWEPADRHKKYLADVEIPEPETLWEDFSPRSSAPSDMGPSITSRLHPRRTMVADVQKTDWPAGSIDLSGMTEKEKGKAAYQKYLHDYLGCVKAVDENVGRVLDYLDRTGLAENTLVIYTADQGMFLGEHDYFDKRWIYEECLQMPFLLPGCCCMSRQCSWIVRQMETPCSARRLKRKILLCFCKKVDRRPNQRRPTRATRGHPKCRPDQRTQ